MLGPLFITFLHLHSAILEPDLHLSFGEVEKAGHLIPAVPREVHVEEELLFELKRLMF